MSEESFYDPEKTARSWTELHLGEKFPQLEQPVNYQALLAATKWLLPRAMAYYSEELWCAGWMTELDVVLPDMYPEIAAAADALGEIPTYFGYHESDDTEHVTWRKWEGLAD